jgi:hypothetical protein
MGILVFLRLRPLFIFLRGEAFFCVANHLCQFLRVSVTSIDTHAPFDLTRCAQCSLYKLLHILRRFRMRSSRSACID